MYAVHGITYFTSSVEFRLIRTGALAMTKEVKSNNVHSEGTK